MLAGLHRIGCRTSTLTNVSLVCLTNSLRRPAVMAAKTDTTQTRPSSDMALFREKFGRARAVAILTGAGISAESGVPTFRGEGGFWRTYSATDLATPVAFRQNPALVWEFYHYRRELVRTKQPNKAHFAIADCERRLARQGRRVTVITQNIDGLHYVAGSRNVIPLHGDLFTTRCLKCNDIDKNMDSPICPALKGKGQPEPEVLDAVIPEKDLPRCKKNGCGGLLRPFVIWFGENLDRTILENAEHALQQCDLCLVIGTSSVVYPAAMFAPEVARRGIPVAEFNTEETLATLQFGFHFKGLAGDTVPEALALHPDEPVYDD